MADIQDLIDFHVNSLELAIPISTSSHSSTDTEENLIDTDLPVLEQKLQTVNGTLSKGSNDAGRAVDLEDILITIDDTCIPQESSESENEIGGGARIQNNNELLFDVCVSSKHNATNEEVIDVLMKLDEVLDETLNKSGKYNECNDLDSPVSQDTSDVATSISVESCLRDLDNYLKTFDSSALEDVHSCIEPIPGKSESSEAQTDASLNLDSLEFVEELEPDRCVTKANLAPLPIISGEGSYENQGYENTEAEMAQTRRFAIRRSHSHRSDTKPFRRSVIGRQSLGSGRISGTAAAMGLGLSEQETKWNVPISHADDDVESFKRSAIVHPTGDCCIGSVQVSFIITSRGLLTCCGCKRACSEKYIGCEVFLESTSAFSS